MSTVAKKDKVMDWEPGQLPKVDCGQGCYIFDTNGRHQRTLHGLTGQVLLSFQYDPAGRLIKIVDGSGNATAVTRAANGQPLSITSPDGLVTALSVNPEGLVTSATNPAGETTEFTYAAGGLLSSLKTPRVALPSSTSVVSVTTWP